MDGCLVGTLSAWPLPDLLLWLYDTRRTAMVRIGSGFGAATLFLDEGVLFRCEWGHLEGRDVLEHVFALDEASFCVIQRDFPHPPPNFFLPQSDLLRRCRERVRMAHKPAEDPGS
jgi:hypothetical protein